MKKKQLINVELICSILLIMTGIAVFGFKKYYMAFYYFVAVLIINISYCLYECAIKNKNEKDKQLNSLHKLRTQLCYATFLAVVTYILLYRWLNYKSPFADLYIIVLGVVMIVTIVALVCCTCMVKRYRDKKARI